MNICSYICIRKMDTKYERQTEINKKNIIDTFCIGF